MYLGDKLRTACASWIRDCISICHCLGMQKQRIVHRSCRDIINKGQEPQKKTSNSFFTLSQLLLCCDSFSSSTSERLLVKPSGLKTEQLLPLPLALLPPPLLPSPHLQLKIKDSSILQTLTKLLYGQKKRVKH